MATPPPVPGMVLFIRFFCAVALAAVGACVMVAWTEWTDTHELKNYWLFFAAIGLVGGFCVGLVGAKLIEAGLPVATPANAHAAVVLSFVAGAGLVVGGGELIRRLANASQPPKEKMTLEEDIANDPRFNFDPKAPLGVNRGG